METFKSVMIAIGQAVLIMLGYIIDAVEAITLWIGEFVKDTLLPMMPSMLKLFSNKTANMIIFLVIAGYILAINIAAVIMFSADKKYAKRKQNRISESRLMKTCFWGGAIGGIIGMNVFRHKTLKKKFSVGVPILCVIQLILHSFVLGFLGFWAFF